MIPGAGMVRKVALLRNDALGDTLLVLPAATAIKRYDREIRVELVCAPEFAGLMAAHPDVDEVVPDPGGGARALARTLRSRRYDAVLVLRPTPRNAWAVFSARVPIRIGTAFRAYGLLFNHRWYGHRRRNRTHEAVYNLQLVRLLTGRDPGAPQYYLPAPEAARAAALELLKEAGVDIERPIVALHPGTRDTALPWPAGRYAELAGRLREAGMQVLVTGVAEEAPITAQVAAVDGVVDLTGRTGLSELAWVYKQCDCLVANSTGTLHLAAAVGTKVVGMYPAARVNSPVRWGPLGPGHKTFTAPVDNCTECIGDRCPVYNCLDLVPVERVATVAIGMSAQSAHHDRWAPSRSADWPDGKERLAAPAGGGPPAEERSP